MKRVTKLSVVGNSMKTIFSRMSNVAAGVEIDSEGEQLNDVEKSLNRVGIALRENETDWRDFYDVLDEVASKWSTFTDIEKSQVTTALGGTRQRENVLTMIENWDKVKEYAQTGAEASGTAMDKYGIVLDSVSAKQEQLTAKFEEFYNTIANSSWISGLLDVLKVIMDINNAFDGTVGKIALLVAGLTLLNAVMTAQSFVKFKVLFLEIGSSLKTVITYLPALAIKFYTVATAEGVAAATGKAFSYVLTLIEAHPVVAALTALVAVVLLVKKAFDSSSEALQKQHEKAQQAQQDYTQIKDELKGVNDELQTTQQRIDELNGKDKLTFAEKDELEKLKAQNAELEKKAYWLEQNAKIKQQETTDEATKAWNEDFNKKGEYESRYEYTYDDLDNEKYDDISENDYIKEQIRYYGELEQKIKSLSNKQGQWTEAEKKEYESLIAEQKKVSEYLTSVGSRIQTDYIDEYPDVDDKTMQGWKDLQQVIYDCLNPPTRESQLKEELEKLPKAIRDNLQSGDLKDLKDAFNIDGVFDESAYNDFVAVLEKIGIKADKAIQYLNEMAKASSQVTVTPLKGYGDIISEVEDKAKALGNAQKDMNEYGYLNIDTLKSLEKQFGDLSPYLTETADGFIINQSNLDALNNTMLSSYQVALNEAKAGALNVLDQEHKKGLSYESTTQAIKEQLQAQLELARANSATKLNEYNDLGIGQGGLKDYQPYKQAQAQEKAIQDAINNIENNEKNLERAKKTLSTLTKAQSVKGTSGSSSSTNTILQQAKDDIKSLENPIKILDNQIKELGTIDTFAEYDKELELVNQKSVILSQNISQVQQMIRKTKDKETLEYLNEQLSSYKADLANIKDTIDKIRLDRLKLELEELQKPIDNIDNAIKRLGDVNTIEEKAQQSDLLAQKFRTISSNIARVNQLLADTTLSKDMRELLEKELQNLIVDKVGIRDEIEENIRSAVELEKKNAELQAELDLKEKLYNLELELYGNEGRELYEHKQQEEIDRLQAIIDAREKEKEAQENITKEQEYQNKLLDAKIKLQNALNNKTVKILKKQADGSWQYEYSANMSDVKDAQDELKEVQKDYDDWKYDQDTQKIQDEIDSIQEEIDEKDKLYSDMEFHLNQTLEAQKNAISEYYADIEKITQERMESYQKVYGDAWDKVISIAQTKLDKLSELNTQLESKSEYAFETVGADGTYISRIQSFDTGGTINGSGVAFVHDKERVLTQQQNSYFEQLISKLPQLIKLADITKLSAFRNWNIGKSTNDSDKGNSTVISKVECVFPAITSTDGLQRAILDLPRLALQTK